MKKRSSVQYVLLQSAVWGIYGVLNAYINRYFLGMGLSNTLIGAILGASTVVTFLMQPTLAAVVDRGRMTVRQVLATLAALMLLCTASVLLPVGAVAVVALYAAANCLLQISPAFANALGVVGMRSGMRINFGIARGVGSLVFSITVQIAGWLIAAYGMQTVPLFTIALAVGLLAVVLTFPVAKGAGVDRKERAKGAMRFFRDYPRFTLFLLAALLLNMSHSALRNAMYQIAIFKGDANAQGTAFALGAFVELPIMYFFTRLTRYRRCDVWLRVSAIFYIVRSLLLLLLPGLGGFYIAQCTQMLSSALFMVASVYYAGSVLSEKDAVKGQVYLGAATAIGSFVAYVSSGVLLDTVSVPTLLMLSAAVAAVGACCLFASAERVDTMVGADA